MIEKIIVLILEDSMNKWKYINYLNLCHAFSIVEQHGAKVYFILAIWVKIN
jgi:hypothetical protein